MSRKLSFGVELELADVDCSRPIPSDIGSWECGDVKNDAGYYIGVETCIINSDMSIVDPNKVNCTKGGEIHVVPSYDVRTLLDRIDYIFKLFPEAKSFYPSNLHIHVGIPDWTLEECQNIYAYCKKYEHELQEKCFPKAFIDYILDDWTDHLPLSNEYKEYIVNRRCSLQNPKVYDEVKTFKTKEEICQRYGTKGLYFYPKSVEYLDGQKVKSGGSLRCHAIHLQHLFTHNTVEFRNFAPTTDIYRISEALYLCQKFVEEALKGEQGEPFSNYAKKYRVPDWFAGTPDLEVCQYWFDHQQHSGFSTSLKYFRQKEVK